MRKICTLAAVALSLTVVETATAAPAPVSLTFDHAVLSTPATPDTVLRLTGHTGHDDRAVRPEHGRFHGRSGASVFPHEHLHQPVTRLDPDRARRAGERYLRRVHRSAELRRFRRGHHRQQRRLVHNRSWNADILDQQLDHLPRHPVPPDGDRPVDRSGRIHRRMGHRAARHRGRMRALDPAVDGPGGFWFSEGIGAAGVERPGKAVAIGTPRQRDGHRGRVGEPYGDGQEHRWHERQGVTVCVVSPEPLHVHGRSAKRSERSPRIREASAVRAHDRKERSGTYKLQLTSAGSGLTRVKRTSTVRSRRRGDCPRRSLDQKHSQHTGREQSRDMTLAAAEMSCPSCGGCISRSHVAPMSRCAPG